MRVAGEAMARLPSATSVDAIVMATAARHGGVVFTSDVDGLTRSCELLPSVRVLAV